MGTSLARFEVSRNRFHRQTKTFFQRGVNDSLLCYPALPEGWVLDENLIALGIAILFHGLLLLPNTGSQLGAA